MKQMETTCEQRRHEAKMIVPAAQLHRFSTWLRFNEADFTTIYHPRWINNIYFDTEELAALTEAIEGDSRRLKVRLRWYGDLAQFSDSALEFKCKVGSLGWKRAWPITEPFHLASQSWSTIIRTLKAAVPVERRVIFEQACRPTLVNRYWRVYYISFDRSLRITLDRHMCSWMQFAGRRPNLRHARRFTGHAVLEFKASHDNAMVLARTFADLEGRISKYSKYVAGMVGLTQVDHRW